MFLTIYISNDGKLHGEFEKKVPKSCKPFVFAKMVQTCFKCIVRLYQSVNIPCIISLKNYP